MYRRPHILITIICIGLLASSFADSPPTTIARATGPNGPDDLPGWSHNQPLTITNTGAPLTDYQVQVDLNSSNFTFADARTDGGDIRFTDTDGHTLLSYWLESYNAGTQTGKVWVKVPLIPEGEKTIHMAYGNSEATTLSNGTGTFEFFDDFESPFSTGGNPLINASNYQTTPTYDGSGQIVHPDVMYFPDGWNGFDYWMAMTPYPNGNALYENPSILASNDGSTWVVPDGLVNPIAHASDNDKGDVADPELFYDSSMNQLWAYYVDQNHALSTTYLKRQPSFTGINWGPEETCETVVIDKILSPAIVKIGSVYYMWSVNLLSYSAGTTQVEYRTSTNGCTWSTPEIVSISLPGYYVWHIDVVYVASQNEYRMLFAAYPNTSFGSGNTVLYYATSTDRLNWTTYSKIALGKGSGWDSSQIYRSSLIYDEPSNLLRVWYSARGGTGWHLGYTERDFDDFIADLIAEGTWTIRQGDGTWSRSQEQAYKGSYSAKLVQGTGANMIVTHPQGINNNFYQEWNLYDDMDPGAFKIVRVMNSASETVGIGVWTVASASMYAYHNKSYGYSITAIPRTLGWHKFGILIRSDSSATFYIDDQEVGSLSSQFNNAAFIDAEGYATGSTTYYVDDFRVRKYASPEPTLIYGLPEPPEPAAWYDPDWGYRRPVTISNPGSLVTEYQVEVALDTSGHALADGSDLRVTSSDGTTLLPYWIETWDSGTRAGTLWIRVPSIPVEGTTIYIYYGNPTPPPAPGLTETPPIGPFTRAAGNPIVPIGDPLGNGSNLVAENIVFDSVSNHYWMVLANYRSGSSVGLVWSDTPAVPSSWHWHTGNPVVPLANAPHILYYDGYWYIFYADRVTERWGHISVARSATIDGTYTFVDDVLEHTPGTWESYRVDEPYVFYRDSDHKWVMIYMGETGATDEQIGYATADNILGPYTKYAGNPCIPFGPAGSYDAGTVADPWVVEFHGTYYIGYTVSPTSHSPWQTAYATTTDWLTFTRQGILFPLGPTGAWDAVNAFRGAVTRIEGATDADDYYILAYTGDSYQMGTATQPVYQLPATINNNPTAVFDFYDAFDGSSLDSNKWTKPSAAGTVSVSSGFLTLTASSNLRINAVPSFGMNYLVESRARHVNAGTVDYYAEVGLIGPNAFLDTVRIFSGTGPGTYWRRHSASGVSNPNFYNLPQTLDTDWHVFRTYRLTPNVAGFQIDNNSAVTDVLTTPTINLYPFLMSYGSGNQFIVDWLRVRKYVANPPTLAVGSEENHPTAVTVSSFTGSSYLSSVQLNWETASEVELVGFNVYCSESLNGTMQKQNPNLIPAKNPGQMIGAAYQFNGRAAPGRRYYYWLEIIRNDGSQLSEPVTVMTDYLLYLPLSKH